MRLSRAFLGIVAGVLLLVAAAWGLYHYADLERLELDQSVRASAPGSFIALADGFTHYELGGPARGSVVVLAAGFSVPYYIWDPSFTALVDAGFRVLRYDYYGRGYSDRPDIPFTQDLYVRQLMQLLNALHIDDSIDLAGISFGGSVITSFAARYPDRVRSLIYFDPSFRTPYTLGFPERHPGLWNYAAAVLQEPFWAVNQLGDFLHPERFPDWPSRYRVQLQYKGFRRARLSETVNNATVDQTAELKHVGQHSRPVLVIWGKEDRTVSFGESVQLLKLMPRARLVAVESAAHLPQWEQPEAVHSNLIAFLPQ